jgi:hypothetical protein
MITRDHDITAYQLVHKLIFKYNWTKEDEDKLQYLDSLIKQEDPKDYLGNRIMIFVDVFGKVEFIKKYFPKRL